MLAIVEKKLVMNRPAPEFKRVIMRLGDILTGDFFTEYIKLRMPSYYPTLHVWWKYN